MSYSYEIKNNMIIEYFTYLNHMPIYKEKVESWHINMFCDPPVKINFEDKLNINYVGSSYIRTKEWLLKNYPELIL